MAELVLVPSVEDVRVELQSAVYELRERGLTSAAMWAAELGAGLLPPGREEEEHVRGRVEASLAASRHGDEGCSSYNLARCYFDCKEFGRAAACLSREAKANGRNLEGRPLFLKLYSDFLNGAARQAVQDCEEAGPLGRGTSQNESAVRIIKEVECGKASLMQDGFVTYVYALALLDRERQDEARTALVASVAAWPWNWSAWKALQGLCADAEAVMALPLPDHWMRNIFLASLCLELQYNSEGLNRFESLKKVFPRSDYVDQQIATAHYNMREFDIAQTQFEALQKRDPHRIDGMDIYSNILYVKEMLPQLSHLAHAAVETDKFRAETCCIIGNYYSLKSQHEKAVAYFKRALRVNPKYLSAWTLMGHEYVELKNPRAAINCYRRAVDINPRDYRAWYGLGQTYEILAMPFYALYYYRQATTLRPLDARMWCAMGQCYEAEALGMPEAAIRCYLRAESNNDREGIALPKLGKLYQQLGQEEEAAASYRKSLEKQQGVADVASPDAIDAMLFLASFCRRRGDFRQAEQFCMRLMDSGGSAREHAKALLRDLHSEIHQRGQQRSGFPPPERDASRETPGSTLDISPDVSFDTTHRS